MDADTLVASEFDVAVDADRLMDFGFSALLFAGEEGALFAASAMTGTLWKIDVARALAQKLDLPRPLWGACALAHAAVESQAGG